jgi:hypothetical protein
VVGGGREHLVDGVAGRTDAAQPTLFRDCSTAWGHLSAHAPDHRLGVPDYDVIFTMVTGLFALLTAPFMPSEMLQNAPRPLGLDPRWTLALTAALGAIIGRLCWLGLRNDPPSNWGE